MKLQNQSYKILLPLIVSSVAIVLLTNLLGKEMAHVTSNMFFIAVPGSVFVLSTIMIKKASTHSVHRNSCILFALFAAFSLVAELSWIIYDDVLNEDPFPSVADFFYLAGYVFLFSFLLYYLKPLQKSISKPVFVFATLISTGFLIPSLLITYELNSSASMLEIAVALSYPIIDALLIALLSIGIVLFFKGHRNLFWSVIFFATLSFTIGDTFFLAQSMEDTYYQGSWIDLFWICGYILFSFAAYNYTRAFKKYEQVHNNLQNDANEFKSIKFETVNRLVIPMILGTIILITVLSTLQLYYFDDTSQYSKTNILSIIYWIVGTMTAFSIVIMVINQNLMKLVHSRTHELEQHKDRLEQEVLEKNKAMEKSERLAKIGELASRLTHNLRNPLTVIKGTVGIMSVMSQDKMDEKTKSHLERIEKATVNMSDQIEEVLSFVRNRPLNLESIRLSKIVESAIGNIDKPNTVEVILPQHDFELKCDLPKLQVVFMNLLTNSIQAMENRGEIAIKSFLTESDMVIHVQDSGPGIPNDVLPKIFDTLFTTKSFGTGLGLPYCKSVIEQHGGTITAKANPTTFIISLPRKLYVGMTNLKTEEQIENISISKK